MKFAANNIICGQREGCKICTLGLNKKCLTVKFAILASLQRGKWMLAHYQCSTLIFLLTCPLGNYDASFTCRAYFLVAQKKHQLALLAVSLNFQYLCLLTLMSSINPKREVIWYHCLPTVKNFNFISFRSPMTFGIFDLVCFSQRRLLVEIQLSSCLLVP